MPGAVRFGKEGRLEMFDGAEWTPVQRLSDTDLPPVLRSAAVPSSASDDAGDSGDAEDSGNADDQALA